jgi:hypothetical protein
LARFENNFGTSRPIEEIPINWTTNHQKYLNYANNNENASPTGKNASDANFSHCPLLKDAPLKHERVTETA